jgi:Domain of unknown function (DUF4411)
MMYLLDADTLISSSNIYYKMKRWMPFWEWLKQLGESGKVKIPVEQYDEIVSGTKDDELVTWLRQEDVKKALLLDEEADPIKVSVVTETGYANDLTEIEIMKIGKDPFLVSYALDDPKNRCVVSFEISAPTKQRANRKLPDVCNQFGIRCIKVFTLIEELDFKLP